MFLKVASYWETLVTLWAVKRLLFCVDPFMLLQGTWSWKILVTLCALEWNLSWVGSHMLLQVASNWEGNGTLWVFQNLLFYVGPLMFLSSCMLERISYYNWGIWIAFFCVEIETLNSEGSEGSDILDDFLYTVRSILQRSTCRMKAGERYQ